MTVTKPPLEEYYARYAPRTHGLPTPIPKYEFPRGREFYKRIGEPKRVVAPMVELGDLAWRILARRYGAELSYTPMIHARLYSRPQTGEAFRQKHFSTRPEDRPLIAQVCFLILSTLLTV
jgi:Dihydrouridine synthase (Dus)